MVVGSIDDSGHTIVSGSFLLISGRWRLVLEACPWYAAGDVAVPYAIGANVAVDGIVLPGGPGIGNGGGTAGIGAM